MAAASEYGQDGRVVFRRDVEAFLDPAAIRAMMVDGRRELEPRPDPWYAAFVDPSGGSQDSMTLAIAHAEGDLAVLDAVREVLLEFMEVIWANVLRLAEDFIHVFLYLRVTEGYVFKRDPSSASSAKPSWVLHREATLDALRESGAVTPHIPEE